MFSKYNAPVLFRPTRTKNVLSPAFVRRQCVQKPRPRSHVQAFYMECFAHQKHDTMTHSTTHITKTIERTHFNRTISNRNATDGENKCKHGRTRNTLKSMPTDHSTSSARVGHQNTPKTHRREQVDSPNRTRASGVQHSKKDFCIHIRSTART